MHSHDFLLLWHHFFICTLFLHSLDALHLPDSNNITLFNDAHFRRNSISLTQELTCNSSSSSSSPSSSNTPVGVGRAFYKYPIRFLDPARNSTASFSSRFSFSIIPSPVCPFGDGFTFLITSNGASYSHSDGHMGLPESAKNTQDSYIAVEFDTSFNPALQDINGNHIGIDVNKVISFASVDALSKGIDLKSGREMTAWIRYSQSLKTIWVWVGNSRVRPPSPILSTQLDLSGQLKEFMHVGFSASNGPGSALHLIHQWRFRTSGFLTSTINTNEVEEEDDCLFCYPDDNTFNFHENTAEIKEIIFGLGGLAIFSVIALLCLATCCLIRKNKMKIKKRFTNRRKEDQKGEVQINKVPTRLSLSEVKSATMGFNPKRIIGEGASATVYEGFIPSNGPVAVKRFNQINQINCLTDPFTTEFATMAGCLRHRNLVQLQGWCCEGNELVLVYEYLPNGSLDKILHEKSKTANFLTWEKRLNIILGVASALSYLHEECERQIIHRDVKSCNIMIDSDFTAKLGDFGLAEVYERSSSTREATIPAGTIGYLAPEYVYSGIPTEKTDVYSFGVVILEVVTGRRPVDNNGITVVDWVWDKWEKRKLIMAVDCRLMELGFITMEMERVLMVGLCCVHPNYEKRPTVKEAARMIIGEATLPVLPARKPTIMIRSVLPESSQQMLTFSDQDINTSVMDTPWLTPRSHF